MQHYGVRQPTFSEATRSMLMPSPVISRWAALLIVAVLVLLWFLSGTHPSNESEQPSAQGAGPSSNVIAVTPATPAVTKAPSAAVQPVVESFQSQADLWTFASRGLTSLDSAIVFEATEAVNACSGVKMDLPDWQMEASNAKSPLVGKLTPERQLAIDVMTQRCAGFIRLSMPDVKKVQKALERHAQEIGSAEQKAEKLLLGDSPVDTDMIEPLLDSRSPAARMEGLMSLMRNESAAPTTKAEEPSRQVKLLETAIMLAPCSLGTDCTPNAFFANWICITNARCGMGQMDGWEAEFTEEEAAYIRRARDYLVASIRDRTFEVSKLRHFQ